MFEKDAAEKAENKIKNFIVQQWGVSLISTEPNYETVEGAPHFYQNSLTTMWKEGAEYGYNKAKEEAEDIINELLIDGYNESTREKALNFLYPDKEEPDVCEEYYQKSKEHFISELADIICCVLIIAGKEDIDIERAIYDCIKKNERRANGIGDKL